MDFRAVLIFLCLHTAYATTEQEKNDALNQTISKIQKTVLVTLEDLNEHTLLPKTNCSIINTKVASVEQQPLTTKSLCTFCYYLSEMARQTPELARNLLSISQHIQDMMDGCVFSPDCKLPKFEQVLDRYQFLKCLLEDLHERLKKQFLDSAV